MSDSELLRYLRARKHSWINEGRGRLQFSTFSISKRHLFFSAVHKSISSVSSLVLPYHHEYLYNAFLEESFDSSIVLSAVVDIIRSDVNRSIEERTLQ